MITIFVLLFPFFFCCWGGGKSKLDLEEPAWVFWFKTQKSHRKWTVKPTPPLPNLDQGLAASFITHFNLLLSQVSFNSLRFCLCCSLDRRTSAKSHACECGSETSSCIVFDEVLNFVPEILLKQEALRKCMGLDETHACKCSAHRAGRYIEHLLNTILLPIYIKSGLLYFVFSLTNTLSIFFCL